MKKIIAVALSVLACSNMAFANDPHAGNMATKEYSFKNHCVMGITMGKEVPCDPSFSEATTWTDPATSMHYCFSTPEMKTAFATSIKDNLSKANNEWAKIHTHDSHAANTNTGHSSTH